MASSSWMRNIVRSTNNNSSTIMAGMAIAGVVATAVLAVRATPKAQKKIEEISLDADKIPAKPEVVKEVVLATWKIYLPTVISGACTIALIASSNRVAIRKQVAMAGAYTLLDAAFRNYKDEVVAQIGATKERRVHDEAMKKRMDRYPVADTQVILVGGGDQLMWESQSGRYFRSDMEDIRKAANDFNQNILCNGMYADLNEWFAMLGLEPTRLGEILGWNVERFVHIIPTAHISTTGEPCIALGYKFDPFEDFGKL